MRLNSRAAKFALIAAAMAFSATAMVLALPSVAKVAGGNKASQPKAAGSKAATTDKSKKAAGNNATSQQPEPVAGKARSSTDSKAADTTSPTGKSEPVTGKEEQAEVKPDVWSADEIAAAKAYCDKILHGVEAVIEPVDPVKQGECGAPAPVRLISVGRSPEVVLSPPVTVTCDMVVKLADWIKDDVQELAKAHLGAPIVRISTMSSYSCRNAYGRKKTRLSEHGRANAVDLGSFTTSSGVEVDLLSGWGMTARDIRAVVAAAKAAAEKAAAEKAAAEKAAADKAGARTANASGKEPSAGKTVAADSSNARAPASIPAFETRVAKAVPEPPVRKTVVLAMAKAPSARKSRGKSDRGGPSNALTVASHLGGPDSDVDTLAALNLKPQDSRSRFLRAAHVSACRRFGTVLGPEANDAHRNHFHLDMAERKRSNYCE